MIVKEIKVKGKVRRTERPSLSFFEIAFLANLRVKRREQNRLRIGGIKKSNGRDLDKGIGLDGLFTITLVFFGLIS